MKFVHGFNNKSEPAGTINIDKQFFSKNTFCSLSMARYPLQMYYKIYYTLDILQGYNSLSTNPQEFLILILLILEAQKVELRITLLGSFDRNTKGLVI